MCYLKMLIYPYLCWKNKTFNKEQLSKLNTETWESCVLPVWQNPVFQQRLMVPWGYCKLCQVSLFWKNYTLGEHC